MTNSPQETGEAFQERSPERADSLRSEMRELNEARRAEVGRFHEQGRSITETMEALDNDYSVHEQLYREVVGCDLISDVEEATRHEIPITKKCSIVIPSYNNSAPLRRCLASIQASTFNAKYPQNLEVVIVDDGSPKEDIAAAVAEMGFDDLTVKVYRQENGGAGKARYSGVLEAEGDVVLLTDPDIVYSPTMIEEYMKRHEVLEGVVCFGLRGNIDPSDPRIQPENVEAGSLGELPDAISVDARVADRGLADSAWLKQGGNDRTLPIDVGKAGYDWTLNGMAWSLSVSAERKALVETFAAYDPKYKGWGGEDDQMTAALIATGKYVLPNTGGLAYHQDHPTNYNPERHAANVAVLKENLASPLKVQDPENPQLTDAKLSLELKNERLDAVEVAGLREHPPRERAREFIRMGLESKAKPILADLVDQMKVGMTGEDISVLADYAYVLMECGGPDLAAAVEVAREMSQRADQGNWSRLVQAGVFARAGGYGLSRELFEAARDAGCEEETAFLKEAADELHAKGLMFLKAGKLHRALGFYDQALVAAGGVAEAPHSAHDKAVVLMRMGDAVGALEVLEEAAPYLQERGWSLATIGMAYEQAGNLEKAKENYLKALEISPDEPEAAQGLERIQAV